MERISGGGAVQLVLGMPEGQVAQQVRAAFRRCIGGMADPVRRRPVRVLVTEEEVPRQGWADAVVLLSEGCTRQVFPCDPRRDPIRLRLPLSVVALRVALDYAALKGGRPGRRAARS